MFLIIWPTMDVFHFNLSSAISAKLIRKDFNTNVNEVYGMKSGKIDRKGLRYERERSLWSEIWLRQGGPC